MHYPSSHRLTSTAFPPILVVLLFLALVSGSVPGSDAARNAAPALSAGDQNSPATTFGGMYTQTNLVSDLPGIAFVEDRQLVNPWGVALNASSPFWVVNKKTDQATLYKGDVAGPLAPNAALPAVTILNNLTITPPLSRPTAVVANNTNDFLVSVTPTSPAVPAQFLFATLNGGINAWQPGMGQVAFLMTFRSGHQYTGLAIGSNASGNFIFATDFANGKIDVFDKNFNQSSVSGNFADATVPANFYPFNIQHLNGSLYVTYTEALNLPNSGFDLGYVRKFDTNGVRDTTFAINNGPLAAPYGLAIAPANFGAFSNLLLVGNFRSLGIGNPTISAFNPATGVLIGKMVDGSGANLEIERLRGLVFGNGVDGGDPAKLYFAAGIYSEKNGLFGSLKPVTGPPAALIRFSNTEYFTSEASGHFDVTVTRTGDLSGTATVNYATVDLNAVQVADYEISLGRLTFNPGESSKTFRVLIIDDHKYAGGSAVELELVLSNATGAALASPNTARLRIMDDEGDTPGQPPNTSDDPQLFVKQQYFDFLNREPDASGFNFWVNQITSCGTDQRCIELRRINVSAAFFLSIEFQKTGMIAYLTGRVASGGLPRYGPFMRDVQALQKDYVVGAPGASAQLETNTRAFFDEYITRPEFTAKYGGLANQQYVDALLASGGISTSTGRLFITRLDGSQVVPPVSTSATGVAIARISVASLDTVDFSLALKNLGSPQTAAHTHGPALAGSNAPTVVTLPNGEFRDFTVTLTGPQGIDMRNGRLYLDVHTQNNPDGEIRGQISAARFQRDVLTNALNAGTITRAEAFRLIVEDGDFRQAQLNRAFVLMEYFGYLRRNPDDPPDNNLSGYNFWLAKLDEFNGNYIASEMVKAFIQSSEYRGRFGP